MQKAPVILTSDKKSFAYFTVSVRYPDITGSLIKNTQDVKIKSKLEKILASFPGSPLELLSGTSDINKKINAEIKANAYRWDNTTFLFAENYFYHLLYEVMDYKNNKFDYFAYKKNPDVVARKDKMAETLKNIDSIIALPFAQAFKSILLLNLMGNQADLSHMSDLRNDNMILLIDHAEKAAALLEKSSRVDIILDNSGEELFFDLLLVHCIFLKTKIKTVKLHFKAFPYFVSDSMISDFNFLLKELSGEAPDFVKTMQGYVNSGSLILSENEYWSNGEIYRTMPKDIKDDLDHSDLLIFKGDLNYRRLIEDRYYDWTTNTGELVDYMHNNCLIIRILKSEIQAGLDKAVIPDLNSTEWMFSGKYGMIELCQKA